MKQDPDRILDWKESKFYLWLSVSSDARKDEMLERAVAITYAVWEPKKLPNLFNKKRPMTEEEAVEAIQRAEEIKKNTKFKTTT